MHYQEYRPAACLQTVIDCFWRAEISAPRFERGFDLILPDACTDLLFNLSSHPLQFIKGKEWVSITNSQLIGQRTACLRIQPSPGISLFAIRFKPHGLSAFTDIAQQEVREEGCCLPEEILGSLAGQLALIVYQPGCPSSRLPQIEKALFRAMATFPSPFTSIGEMLLEVLKTQGKLQVKDLCRHSGLHKSTIENYFRRYVGLRPKEYTRIIRFNHLLMQLHELSDERNLTHLSYEAGYTDQSHMIREFRAFTGHTPSQFIKRNFRLSKVTETYIRNREKYYPFP